MAEVCAEHGYAGASVSDVAKRAGVSSVTFYKQFAGKRDCMLAAHRQLLERLFEGIDRAVEAEGGGDAKAKATVRSVLSLLAADAPSARLLTVEILATGPEGAKCHDAMVGALARRLRGGDDRAEDHVVANADWARVAGMLALVAKLVMAGEAARLLELEDELVALVPPS